MQHYLYNNSIELNFDEERHLYHVGGVKIDGVTGVLTTIAKPALIYWAVNECIKCLNQALKPGEAYDEIQIAAMLEAGKTAHRKKSGEASQIGKMVHQWIEDYIAGKNPTALVHAQAKKSVEQFLQWEKDHKVKFLESERIIYSKEYKYAGTLDFICEYEGKKWLGDFKTSSGIWDEYWIQTAAYQHAYQEEFPQEDIEGIMIVRIGKDGGIEFKMNTPEDYKKDFNAFLGTLMLHRRLNERKFMKEEK